MEVVGPSDPTSHKRRGDAVVLTLARLIAASKAVYREPLLDALYSYRRREGIFIALPDRLPPKRGKTKILILGVGSPASDEERPDPASPVKRGLESGRLPGSRTSRRLTS